MEPQDFAPTPGVEPLPFDGLTAAPAPAPEPAADPVVDTPPAAPDAAAESEAVTVESLAADGWTPVANHAIEHRSFARADADQPLPVTVITGA